MLTQKAERVSLRSEVGLDAARGVQASAHRSSRTRLMRRKYRTSENAIDVHACRQVIRHGIDAEESPICEPELTKEPFVGTMQTGLGGSSHSCTWALIGCRE
jgi:hypothetical protein